MKKTINFDGYTECEIVKRYPNGDCLCNLAQIIKTAKTDTTDASEQIVKSDTNIVFTGDNLPFTLTALQIEKLNPTPIQMETKLPL